MKSLGAIDSIRFSKCSVLSEQVGLMHSLRGRYRKVHAGRVSRFGVVPCSEPFLVDREGGRLS